MPSLIPAVVPADAWSSRPQPRIEGAGLTLRPWHAGDEKFLLEAYSDATIQRWHVFAMSEPAEATAYIERHARRWQAGSGADWCVTEAGEGGEPLGRIGFRVLDLEYGEAEVAYWVGPRARRAGVASRALDTLTGWAKEQGLHRLTLLHSVQNEPSCRVANRCGYSLEGTALRALLHADGWHDAHMHARLLE